MPTYEYVCENCGVRFEQFQSINARPLRKCKKCGRNQLKRLIGCGAGVIFKGSGFYETDYRSDDYKKAQKNEEKSTKDSGKKDSAGKDDGKKKLTENEPKKSDSQDKKKSA